MWSWLELGHQSIAAFVDIAAACDDVESRMSHTKSSGRPGQSGGAVSDQGDVALWSVDDDWSQLGVTWSDSACASGATISLVPTFGRYDLHVISTSAECAPTLLPYSAVLYLTESIDVRLVDASLERLVD